MRFTFFSCVVIAGCATAGSGTSPRPATETVRVATGGVGTNLRIGNDDAVAVRKVAGTPDIVFRLLPLILDSLGIPVNSVDAAKHTIGNTGFNIRGKLKGVPLSRYIECGGATQMGPNADSYSINFQFIVEVKPDKEGSALVTTLQAMGKPINFAQDYSPCGSKGNLENRLSEMVAAKLPH